MIEIEKARKMHRVLVSGTMSDLGMLTKLWNMEVPYAEVCQGVLELRFQGSIFQLGFPGTLGLCQHSPGILPEVIQMLRSTVYFNSPGHIYEQAFLVPLAYILGLRSTKRVENHCSRGSFVNASLMNVVMLSSS